MVSATIDDATDGHCTQPARYMPLTRTATSFNKRLKLAEAVLIQVHAKEQERLAARKRQQQGLKSEMTAVPTPTPSSASTAAAIVTIASETCGLTSRTRGLTPVNCSLNTSGLAELKAASLTISDAASLTVSEAVRLSASDTTCLSASDTTCLPTSDAASLTSDGARLASDTSSCASNSCSPCSLTSDIDCLAYGSCSLDALDALRVELLVLSDDDLQLAFYEREQRGRGIKAIAAVLQRQYPDFYISSKTVRETMDYADIVFNTSIAGFLSTDLVSQCECCYAKVPLKFCECPRCCSILEQQGGTYENCGQHQSSDSWEQLDTTSDGKFIKFRHRAHPELIVPIPIHDRSRNSLTAYQADCRQRRKRALERHLKAKKLEGNESTSKKRPGKQSEKTAASKAPRTAPVLRQRCWSRPNETEAARRDRIRAEAGSRTERLQTDRQRDLEISSSQQELCTKRGIVRSQLWPPRATSDATPSAHLDRCACAATAFYLYPPSLPLPHLSTSTPPLYPTGEEGEEGEEGGARRFDPMWPFGVRPSGRLPIPESATVHKEGSKQYTSALERRVKRAKNPNANDSPGFELPAFASSSSNAFGEHPRNSTHGLHTGVRCDEQRGIAMLPNPVQERSDDVISSSNVGISCGRKH